MTTAQANISSASDVSSSFRLPAWSPYAILIVAVILTWGQAITFKFVWDDKFFIEDLQSIRSLSHTPQMFTSLAAQSSYPEGFVLFRPLRTLQYGLLFQLGGGKHPQAWLFHLANLLWHAAAAILFYRVLLVALGRAFGRADDAGPVPWVALIAATGFAVHPVVSEVVCWAKSLDDIMATVFLLGSCWLLVHGHPGEALPTRRYWGAVASFALAVYSKESAVPFAAFAAVLLAWRCPGSMVALARWTAPFAAVAIVFVIHRHIVIGRTSQHEPLSGSYAQTLVDTLTAGPIYARLLAGIPPFCADYSFMTPGHALSSPAVIGGAVFVALLCAGAMLVFRRGTALVGAGCLWIILFLLPVSNLIPMMQYCAERFLYLPMLGWFVVLAALLVRCWRPKFAGTIGPAVLVVWAALAWSRSWVWADPVTLFVQTHLEGHSSQRVRDNAVAAAFNLPHMRAAFVRVQQPGRAAELTTRPAPELAQANWPAIEGTLAQLYRLFPDDAAVVGGLAISLAQQGRPADAVPLFEAAAQKHPAQAGPWRNLAQAHAAAGQWPQAEAAIRRALAVESNSIPSLQLLADAQRHQHKDAEASDTEGRVRRLIDGKK